MTTPEKVGNTTSESNETDINKEEKPYVPGLPMYVIGDTHGDENYLFRTLLSTEKFEINGTNHIQWRTDLNESDNFSIFILGDMVDRGHLSKKNVLTARRLLEDPKWGKRLTYLLGNHEEMLMTKDTRYLAPLVNKKTKLKHPSIENDFTASGIDKALRGKNAETLEILQWLGTRDVIAIANGMLMMHGGLSKKLFETVVKRLRGPHFEACEFNRYGEDPTPEQAKRCGEALVAFMNKEAQTWYTKVVTDDAKSRKAHEKKKPMFLSGSGAIMWYRGYSQDSAGAGTAKNCKEAAKLAKNIGIASMSVAHTTHPWIFNSCPQPRTEVPIFLTDTHYKKCAKRNECDYKFERMTHDVLKGINRKIKQAPQSLRVTMDSEGQYIYDVCMSMIGEGVSVIECMPANEAAG